MEKIETPKSSNIEFVEYDGKDLYIQFKSGGYYKYVNVPSHLFKSFESAESAGKFFHANIRNAFDYKKIHS